MKWMNWSMIALLATSFATGGCDDDDDNNTLTWTTSDRDFVLKANEANHAEIEAGKIATFIPFL